MSAAVLVVADDLTGANATAAGFARAGLRAVTVGADQGWDAVPEFAARFAAVVVSTDSRHLPADEAAERARLAVRAGWPVRLVCNRIDTTLRGNVAASTAAVLAEVADLDGRRAVALCAPAHPAAGRQTVEGTQLLDGRRLEDTELADDPRTPMRTSAVTDLVSRGTDLRTALVPLSLVTGERAPLHRAVADAVAGGADVVVADALTTDHLDRVAAAAAAVDDVTWVCADPGPASLAMAGALGLTAGGGDAGAPLLAVSGSATRLTRAQLQRLVGERDVRLVRTSGSAPGGGPVDVDATAAALDAALDDAGAGQVVLVATVLSDDDVHDIAADDAERLPGQLARAVRRALESHGVDGIYSTGGDVTAALLRELGGRGLEVHGEVVPLAVTGAVVGGPWDGTPVVTKGGLVGDAGTALACLDELARAAEANRRTVPAGASRGPAAAPGDGRPPAPRPEETP